MRTSRVAAGRRNVPLGDMVQNLLLSLLLLLLRLPPRSAINGTNMS
jgi:hypothetical protein